MSKLLVSGDTFPPGTNDLSVGADHGLPVGVAQERVDSHTLEVIQLLFKAKGLQFLAAFLCLARAKQCPIPGIGALDCAVITARSIRQLAEQIGWGYDTTEKYLVILCALGFLYKEKSSTGIAYYFPLHRYAPPVALDTLDMIIRDYRPKVQSFARKARRRFLVYLQEQKSPIFPAISPASLPPAFDLSGAEEDIEQIMQEELGNGALPQRLLLKLKGVLRYRCQVDSDHNTPIQIGNSGDFPSQESSFSDQKGDFPQKSMTEESPLLTKKGNSFVAVATGNSRLSLQKGDFPSQSAGISASKKLPISLQKGDSQTGKTPQNGRLLEQTGDLSAEKGDSRAEAASNVNVILLALINTYLNDNDKSKVIEHLRIIFDEPPGKRGYYYNLYKLGYTQPLAWLAAAIETMIAYHNKTTEQPGKYFYDLCITFHAEIPSNVLERTERYGQLTHEQLLATLALPAPSVVSPPARLTRQSQFHAPQIVLRLPREKDRKGLTEQEARQAKKLIRSDERLCTLGIVPYRQTDGSIAFLVDNRSTKHPRQVWIYTIQDCEARLMGMKIQKDFFQERGKQ